MAGAVGNNSLSLDLSHVGDTPMDDFLLLIKPGTLARRAQERHTHLPGQDNIAHNLAVRVGA
jgi:hypothetical protein